MIHMNISPPPPYQGSHMIFLSIGSMILYSGFLATTVLREQILTTYLVLFHLCRRPEKWANQPGQSYYNLEVIPFPSGLSILYIPSSSAALSEACYIPYYPGTTDPLPRAPRALCLWTKSINTLGSPRPCRINVEARHCSLRCESQGRHANTFRCRISTCTYLGMWR